MTSHAWRPVDTNIDGNTSELVYDTTDSPGSSQPATATMDSDVPSLIIGLIVLAAISAVFDTIFDSFLMPS